MKKTVVVTGAGHRIGFAITKELLFAGYNIIAHYRKNRDELQQWLKKHEEFCSMVTYCQADLLVSTETLATLIKEEPTVCGLINSASVFEAGDLLDGKSLENNMAMNTLVPLSLAASMEGREGSSVINILDANINAVNRHFQSYRVSKLFLREITRQLSVTMAPAVRVNGVAPGTVLPPVWGTDASYLAARGKAPLGRDVALGDLTKTVLYLLENRSVTGEVIAVDCGVQAL